MVTPASSPAAAATASETCADLGNDLQAAGRGRALARDAVAGWGLDALVDDVVLVVSELVGNALRHGLPPVGLSVRREGSAVLVTVSDRGTGPLPGMPGAPVHNARESGRGLSIVASLTASLAWQLSEPGPGMTVTAVLTVSTGPPG